MTLSLKDREWGEFFIKDLFTIENCKCSKVSVLKSGKIPYVGATNRNNGVLQLVSHNEKLVTKGNCIAFICDGEGSVGYSVYKLEDFIGSTTVKVGRADFLNREIGHFIVTIADRVRSKYNFGFKRNEKHLKSEILLLPTTPEGEPDYGFMEQYMREQEATKQAKYKAYITQRLEKLKSSNAIEPLNSKEWKEFFIEDAFIINSGVRLTKSSMKKGTIPFIGASDSNNGITEFVSNTNKSLDYNVLGVNYNGSVVENFYHPYKAVFSDDVKRLSVKSKQGNKYTYLFVKTLILKQKSKYEYGYKFNGERMARQKIMLPINTSNEPDYEYMEQYMKALEYKKLKAYLDWKQ